MAGKNKVERSFRLEWDSVDLSGDLIPGSVSGGGLVFDEADMTGVSNSVKQFLTGHPDSPVTARFHVNDTLSTGSLTKLHKEVGVNKTLELQWGSSGSAPTTGDVNWSGTYILLGLPIVVDGNRLALEATFQPYGGTAPDWGTV